MVSLWDGIWLNAGDTVWVGSETDAGPEHARYCGFQQIRAWTYPATAEVYIH